MPGSYAGKSSALLRGKISSAPSAMFPEVFEEQTICGGNGSVAVSSSQTPSPQTAPACPPRCRPGTAPRSGTLEAHRQSPPPALATAPVATPSSFSLPPTPVPWSFDQSLPRSSKLAPRVNRTCPRRIRSQHIPPPILTARKLLCWISPAWLYYSPARRGTPLRPLDLKSHVKISKPLSPRTPSHDPATPSDRQSPLPFRRGEGKGEGSVCSPQFMVPMRAEIRAEAITMRTISLAALVVLLTGCSTAPHPGAPRSRWTPAQANIWYARQPLARRLQLHPQHRHQPA